VDLPRASGILMHPSSLPGPFGIGDLGPAAYRFVDFLVRTGQRWWQILPLGPTGYGNSPYMCFSAFGGNGLLISPEVLVEEKLLDQTDISNAPVFPLQRVDYGRVIPYKTSLLTTSYQRFRETFSSRYPDDFSTFCAQNAFWLEDYALFMALKAAHGGSPWSSWDEGAAKRQADALGEWCNRLADEVQFCKYVQYTFEFIPIKPSAATESAVPGSCAGHSRVPSPDRGYHPSTSGSGLSRSDNASRYC
jgi:4-alpha-glucanotransferase